MKGWGKSRRKRKRKRGGDHLSLMPSTLLIDVPSEAQLGSTHPFLFMVRASTSALVALPTMLCVNSPSLPPLFPATTGRR